MEKLKNTSVLEKAWLMELKDHYNQNSSSVLTSLPVINPSKNTLKFMPNPNFSEEIVEVLK